MPANLSNMPQHDSDRPDLLRYVEEKGAQWAFQKFAARTLINWKTSAMGIAAICDGISSEIIYLVDTAQHGGFSITVFMRGIGIIVGGVGLLFAKDSDKTSEQNDLRPAIDPDTGKVIPRAVAVS